MPVDLWKTASTTGVFKGAPVDLEDGFIHFSTAEQVEETAAKHFFGQKHLLLVTLKSDTFGDDLKWEASRGGDLFPHLYGHFEPSQALDVVELIDLPDGSHKFPEQY